MDVVSVAEQSRIDVWRVASRAVPRFIDAERYRVIVPDHEVEIFRSKGSDQFLVEAESEFASEFSGSLWEAIQDINPKRYGWYLQQLIKIEALRRLGCEGERGVIWDADTVPLRTINFYSSESVHFFYGTEYHLPYFQTIDRLLELDKIVPYSFIAQSFPCEPRWVSTFCEEIESSHQKPWWRAIIDSIDFEQQSGFSEYETLGTFVAHRYPDEWRWIESPWERKGYTRFGSPEHATFDSARFDHQLAFVAFEIRDRERNATAPKPSNFRQLMKYAKKMIRSLRPASKPRDELGQLLSSMFSSGTPLTVVQIGPKRGSQNDFLKPFLEEPGDYRAVLAEPIPQVFQMLEDFYQDRSDIELRKVTCGSQEGTINLFDVSDEVVVRMNESGPSNDWAKRTVSNSRAALVYWIWKNALREDVSLAKVHEWIASIRATKVPVVETQNLVTRAEGDVLLVVGVQGMALESVRGFSQEALPRWILIEKDTVDPRAKDGLRTLGYSCLVEGLYLAFERKNVEA